MATQYSSILSSMLFKVCVINVIFPMPDESKIAETVRIVLNEIMVPFKAMSALLLLFFFFFGDSTMAKRSEIKSEFKLEKMPLIWRT